MVDVTSKQKSMSFILVPIDFSYATSYMGVNSNVCSRTHRLATIHSAQTDDRRTQACRISATVLSTVG